MILTFIVTLAWLVQCYFLCSMSIDSAVFRLHRLSSKLFLLLAATITIYTILADVFDCKIDDGERHPAKLINFFCWRQFMPNLLPGRNVKSRAIDDGYQQEAHVRSHHSYVPFVLFAQFSLFYVPSAIWQRMLESREYTRQIELQHGRRGYIYLLSEHILNYLNFNNGFARFYMFCEILNLVNVMFNIFFVDRFLNGALIDYVSRVVTYSSADQQSWTGLNIEVFPHEIRCNVPLSPTVLSTVCSLECNVFYEKLYVFLTVWLAILFVLSVTNIVYRFVSMRSLRVRRTVMIRRAASPDSESVEALLQFLPYDDYLLVLFRTCSY